MSDTIPTPKPVLAMTIGECVRELLETQRAQAVVIGRIDREIASTRKDVADLLTAVETMQDTLAAVLTEVNRHGQKVAPATTCPGECRATNVR